MSVATEAEAPVRRTPIAPGSVVMVLAVVAIGVLAFVARLHVILHGGGLLGVGDYDDGVYYTAASALIHGRIPYISFLFIQPPGVVLATVPFAALGTVIGDPAGFMVARVAFEVIGAMNAVLIFFTLRRFGRIAPIVGGLFYAIFMPAVIAERSILLEPLGTFFIVLSFLLISRSSLAAAGSKRANRLVIAAGFAAGCSADVKIWYLVAGLLICAFATRHRIRFLIGGAAALLLGYGPFFFASPAAVFRQIVLDQVGRPRLGTIFSRVAGIVSARPVHGIDLRVVTVVLVLAVMAAAVLTITVRGARIYPIVLAADVAVLIAAPSWFTHYADLTAVPIAFCAGVGVQRLLGFVPMAKWLRIGLAALVVIGLIGGGYLTTKSSKSGVHVPAGLAAAMQRTKGCITADDPTTLVVSNVLQRDLADPHCLVWPDVTGWTYDAAYELAPDGKPQHRPLNLKWQRLVMRFLESGDATIVSRRDTFLSAASKAILAKQPPIFAHGRFVLRPTDPDYLTLEQK